MEHGRATRHDAVFPLRRSLLSVRPALDGSSTRGRRRRRFLPTWSSTPTIWEATSRHIGWIDCLQIVLERLTQILGQSFPGWRLVLIPMGLVGLITARRFGTSEWVIFGSAGLLFLLYLSFAHPPQWISYYLEAQFALYLAVGLAISRLPARLLALVAIVVAILAVTDVAAARRHRLDWQQRADAPGERFRDDPGEASDRLRAVRWELESCGLADSKRAALDAAPVWVVRDLGPRNEALRASGADRMAYRYDTTTGRLEPLD